MDDITPHLGWIFEAIAVCIGIAAGLFYIYYRRLRHRMMKVRCADMLLVELGNIGTDVDMVKGDYIPDHKAYQDLPRAVYDGLITSTNISYFDVGIQRTLHSLYASIHRYNIVATKTRDAQLDENPHVRLGSINRPMAESNLEELVRKLEDAGGMVEEFRDGHEPEGGERSVAIIFGLLDEG